MQHNVELSGVNTAKLKVLKNEETQRLLHRIKAGDKEAREELISGNLRLVLSVIQRFANRGENLDDLFQVGCIGLIKAIDNFEVDRGLRLSTYAVPTTIECRNDVNDAIFPIKHGEYRFFITLFLLRYFVSNWQDEDEHQLHRLCVFPHDQ